MNITIDFEEFQKNLIELIDPYEIPGVIEALNKSLEKEKQENDT